MTTTSFSIFLFSVLPVILIITSSIILDVSLRYEKILNRCQCQIGMWLVLALLMSRLQIQTQTQTQTTTSISDDYDYSNIINNNSDEQTQPPSQQQQQQQQQYDIEYQYMLNNIQIVFLVWANITLFFNLLIILAEALLHNRFLILAIRSKRQVLDVLQIFPISSWGSMMVTVFSIFWSTSKTTSTSTSIVTILLFRLSLWTFMGTFFVLLMIRFYLNHHRRNKISSRNIQDSSSFTINSTTANTIDHNGGIMSRLCGSHANTVDSNNNNSTYTTSSFCLDESQWYTWTRIQTMQWFTQQLSITNDDINNNSNNNNTNKYRGGLQRDGLVKTNSYDPAELEEEQDMIVTILTPHRITGNALDMLDVSQLVALGVPYGTAAHLSDSISHLIEKYPTPLLHSVNKTPRRKIGRRNHHLGIVYDDENPNASYALDLHDNEYNSLGRSRQQVVKKIRGGSHDEEIQMQQQQHQRRPVSSQHEMEIDHKHQHQQHHESITPEEGGMTDELHQQLNDVMKERFGLELPKLKADDFYAATQLLSGKESNRMLSHPLTANMTTNTNTDGNGNGNGNGNDHIKTNQPRSDSSTGGGGGSSPKFLENVLDGMPPHLREIAKRRPDLMEKILNQKQGQVIQQNPHATTTLSMVKEGRGNDDDDDDDNDDDDDGDETTSLIQRDGNNEVPLIRYKSIDKSNLNIV
jgi:hypothetical protein